MRLKLAASCAGILIGVPAYSHVMSLSTGELQIHGERAEYGLRMPLYEVPHMKDPEADLFRSFRLFDGPAEGVLESRSCAADSSQDAYICRGRYVFPAPVRNLEVECHFAAVTVPSHVHLLRAERDGAWDEAVFDISTTRVAIRFISPGRAAVTLAQVWAGMVRAVAGLAQLMFLAALAAAARSRREFMWLAAAFLACEMSMALALSRSDWSLPVRFVEGAAALTVCYLAVEILFLPDAGHRWAVAGILGAVHGFYFALFLRDSAMPPLPVLAGVAMAEMILLAAFAALLALARRLAGARRPVQAAAGALLLVGMAWFFLRLRA